MATHTSDISKVVENSFERNCKSLAVSSQTIVLSGLKFTARDGCNVSFMNKATSIAECSMESVIDAIATDLAETDSELAERVADVDSEENSDANTSVTIKERLSSKLSNVCASIASASQYFELKDSEVICDSGSTLLFGNSADVRATCMLSMIQQRRVSTDEEPPEPPVPAPAPAPEGTDIALVVAIAVGGTLLILVLALFLWMLSKDDRRRGNKYKNVTFAR